MGNYIKIFLFVLSIIILFIVTVWGSFWFYASYAKGTWTAWPTIITAIVLPLFFGISLAVITGDESQK